MMSDNSYHRIVIENQQPKPASKPNGKAESSSKPRAKRITKLEQVICPVCKQGHLLAGQAAFGCSRYKEGCTMRLPYDQYDKSLTPSALNKLIKKNFT